MAFSQKFCAYGEAVNSHDALKWIAVLCMTADHVGAYLLPEEMWLRVVGRAAFPVFCFLVGYAKHQRLDRALCIAAAVSAAISILCFYPAFPLNILFTIAASRVFIRFLQKKGRPFLEAHLWELLFALTVWLFPLMLLFEYGSVAFLFALLGHIARTRQEDPAFLQNKKAVAAVFLAVAALHIAYSLASFAFTPLQSLLAAAIILLETCLLMTAYRLRTVTSIAPSGLLGKGIKYLSRYSLEYYVLHKAALQIASVFLVPSHAHVFRWIEI